MLNTPAGTPALSSTSAKICAEYGASCGGLSTIVHPVASAGRTLTATWFIGQFHGVIIAQTPIGSRRIIVRSEEHTSELQSLMRISYAVFCLKKKKKTNIKRSITNTINSETTTT